MQGVLAARFELSRAALIARAEDAAFNELQRRGDRLLITDGIEIVLGIALTFGARGLSALIHRLRYAACRLPVQAKWSATRRQGCDTPES
jgi:hypothetical protein